LQTLFRPFSIKYFVNQPHGDGATERMIVESGLLAHHPPSVRVEITMAASARVITPEGLEEG